MKDENNEAIYLEIQELMGSRTGELATDVNKQGLEVWKIAFGFTFAALAVMEEIEDPNTRVSIIEAVSSNFAFLCRTLVDESLAQSRPN
jgi:hypothetical protein